MARQLIPKPRMVIQHYACVCIPAMCVHMCLECYGPSMCMHSSHAAIYLMACPPHSPRLSCPPSRRARMPSSLAGCAPSLCVHMCPATALHLWSHVQACAGQLWGDQLPSHLLSGGLQATPDGHGGQDFGPQHTAPSKGVVRQDAQ